MRALHTQTDVIGLRGVEQGFRFGDVQTAGDATIVASFGQVESPLLQVDIIFQDYAFLVDEACHDVIFSYVGFHGEQHVLVIGDRGLDLRHGRFHRAADSAPQVDFVAHVGWQGELVIRVGLPHTAGRQGPGSGHTASVSWG